MSENIDNIIASLYKNPKTGLSINNTFLITLFFLSISHSICLLLLKDS